MIASLKGILSKKTTDTLIIDNGGIGYEVIAPLSTFYALPEEGEEVSLHIYTHVREDAFILFGFKTVLEKNIFRLLISVSGIGPKLATNILSGIGPDILLEAIAAGDLVRLQSIPGVGKKTAERIILELKDKVRLLVIEAPSSSGAEVDTSVAGDVLSALDNLGYKAVLAGEAVKKAKGTLPDDYGFEELFKEALKLLSRK